MNITKRNCEIADKIIEILVNEKCTVEESQEILSGVSHEIRRTSTVQVKETLTEKFSSVF